MKNWKTIGRIIFALVFIGLVLLLLDMGGFLSSPTLSAKETYQKASEILKSRGAEVVLTKISTGGISVVWNRSISEQEVGGRGDRWPICFYSKEEDKFVYFVNTTRERLEEQEEWAHHMCIGDENEINIEKWKIDSERAVEIAKDKAKELGKERFIPVSIRLTQKEKNGPVWRIELLPKYVTERTTGLLITINAETGEVIKAQETVHFFEEMD